MEPVNVSGSSQILSLSVLTEDVARLIEVDRVDGYITAPGWPNMSGSELQRKVNTVASAISLFRQYARSLPRHLLMTTSYYGTSLFKNAVPDLQKRISLLNEMTQCVEFWMALRTRDYSVWIISNKFCRDNELREQWRDTIGNPEREELLARIKVEYDHAQQELAIYMDPTIKQIDNQASSVKCRICKHLHADHQPATLSDPYKKIRDIRMACRECFKGDEAGCCFHCRCEECTNKYMDSIWYSPFEKNVFEKRTREVRKYLSNTDDSLRDNFSELIDNKPLNKNCSVCSTHSCHNPYGSQSKGYNPWETKCSVSTGEPDRHGHSQYNIVDREKDCHGGDSYVTNNQTTWVDFEDFIWREVPVTVYDEVWELRDVDETYYTTESRNETKWEKRLVKAAYETSTGRPTYYPSNQYKGWETTITKIPAVYADYPVTVSRQVSIPHTRSVRKKVLCKVPRAAVEDRKAFRCYPTKSCECDMCYCIRCRTNRMQTEALTTGEGANNERDYYK